MDDAQRDLGARHSSEDLEELLRNEQCARRALEAAHELLAAQAELLGFAHAFMRDLEGRIVLWTAGATQLYGFTSDEALGKLSQELLRTRFPQPLADIEAIVERDGVWQGEIVHHHRDGRELMVASHWSLRRTPLASGTTILEVNIDVTATRAAERERERALREEAAILASAGDGIFGVDREGSCTFINPAGASMLGYAPDELIGKNMHEISHYKRADGSPYPKEECPVYRSMQQGAPQPITREKIWRRDGSSIPAEFSAAPIVVDGGVQGTVVTMRDVTQRERQEAAVHASEERLRLFLETVQDYAIFTAGPEGIIETWNAGAERLFGFPSEEALGRPIEIIFTPEDREAGIPKRELREAAAKGCAVDQRWHIRKDGSRFYASGTVRPMKNGDGRIQGFAKIAHDITAREEAARQRERLLMAEERARLDAEQANNAKDDFLAMLSHELRSPLNAMVGWIHILQRGGTDEATRTRAVETLERNVRVQTQVINDLLDVSRIISGKLEMEEETLDIGDLVLQAVEAARPAAEAAGLALRCERDDDARNLPVWGDAKRLTQVMDNLLGNAIKFTGRGGRIDVRVRLVDGYAEISVHDTGQGIAREVLPFIFDRFRQADTSKVRRFGGLGLGLSIVSHLVVRHEGVVEAHSEGSGLGATFIVRLPLVQGVGGIERSWKARPKQRQAKLEGLRVLLIEDDADSREALLVALETGGAQARGAAAVAEGLGLLDDWQPDVVVSDIGMPGESGYDLIREIRARDAREGRHTTAIALTGYASREDYDRSLRTGFDDHLAKPIEPDALLAKLRTLGRVQA